MYSQFRLFTVMRLNIYIHGTHNNPDYALFVLYRSANTANVCGDRDFSQQ